MFGNIIVPAQASPQQREIRAEYEIWRVAHDATQPVPKIENIRFTHDPEWREHFMSITYAASGRGLFWNAIGLLFFAALPFAYFRFW